MTDITPRPGRPRVNTPAGPAAPIGEAIRARRVQRGLSQTDLANKVGVSIRTLGGYETGERVPPLDTAAAIAAALGCEVSDLLGATPKRVARRTTK